MGRGYGKDSLSLQILALDIDLDDMIYAGCSTAE